MHRRLRVGIRAQCASRRGGNSIIGRRMKRGRATCRGLSFTRLSEVANALVRNSRSKFLAGHYSRHCLHDPERRKETRAIIYCSGFADGK